MRRILSFLLLTLWLLMNGSSSYAFFKSTDLRTDSKQSINAGTIELKSAFIFQSVVNDEDRCVFYEEEDEEDEEDVLHANARLHAVILYQLLFLFEGADFSLSNFAYQSDIAPASTPVYLACQNIRI